MLQSIEKILGGLDQWYRIIGPAFLSLGLLFGGLGYFLYKMYTFNVTHKILGNFPSQITIEIYFIFGLLTAFLIIVMVVIQSIVYNGQLQTEKNNTF